LSSFILSSELCGGIGGCGGVGCGSSRGDRGGGIGGSGGVIGGGFKIATAKHCTCVVYALISNVVYLMQDADSNQHLRED
jgi:hypothetical protein